MRATLSQREALRSRVVERMDEILDIIKADYQPVRTGQIDRERIAAILGSADGVIVRMEDGRGFKIEGDCDEITHKLETASASEPLAAADVRRPIIRIIAKIASFAPETASDKRKKLKKVEHAADILRIAYRDLSPPSRRAINPDLDAILNQIIGAARQAANNIRPTERTNWQQVKLAAQLVYDLVNEWGDYPPSLTGSGPYIELTAILFEVATGRPCGTAARACTQYIAQLKPDGSQPLWFPPGSQLRVEDLNQRIRRGRRPRQPAADQPRIERPPNRYPRLERLLDEMLR
jgi:hypothetical protein